MQVESVSIPKSMSQYLGRFKPDLAAIGPGSSMVPAADRTMFSDLEGLYPNVAEPAWIISVAHSSGIHS